jgi:hypothetical protein
MAQRRANNAAMFPAVSRSPSRCNSSAVLYSLTAFGVPSPTYSGLGVYQVVPSGTTTGVYRLDCASQPSSGCHCCFPCGPALSSKGHYLRVLTQSHHMCPRLHPVAQTKAYSCSIWHTMMLMLVLQKPSVSQFDASQFESLPVPCAHRS